MRIQETINYNPIDVELSVRAEEIRAITSCRAGKIVPHCVVPVLREDSVRRGSVTLDLEMAETVLFNKGCRGRPRPDNLLWENAIFS